MKKRVNFSEILVKNLVKHYHFKNDNLLVGDNFEEGLPDIYSLDKRLGIEVVEAELEIDYRYNNELIPNCLGKSGSLEKCLEIKNKLENSLKHLKDQFGFSKGSDLFNVVHNDRVVLSVSTNEMNSRNVDYANKYFEKKILSKIKKSKNGNYKGIQGDKYLALFSISRSKGPYESKNVFKLFKEHNDNTFSGLIVVFSCLLQIYVNDIEEPSSYEIPNDIFNEMIRKSSVRES